VKQYTGASLYNYAVSGAVCSNTVTPRIFGLINAPFPAISQYELPAFIADSKYVEPSGKKFFNGQADTTVYAMWIGTNDLGVYALLTDSQVKGTNLTSYTDCVYNQFDRIYRNGGRNFVLFNNAPLQLAPLYGAAPYGVGPNQYWQNKPKNHTQISYKMLEEVVSANAIFEYRTPVAVELRKRYPGASFAIYDVNSLVSVAIHSLCR
jgi:hypothetical protein